MPSYTADGWPYVTGSDTVTSYPVTSLEIANKLASDVPVSKVFTKTTDASGFLSITAAELGLTTITGAIGAVQASSSVAAGNSQLAGTRIASATSLQMRIWSVSAATAGQMATQNSVSVTVYVLAW